VNFMLRRLSQLVPMSISWFDDMQWLSKMLTWRKLGMENVGHLYITPVTLCVYNYCIILYSFSFSFFSYCAGWGYIMAFTKVLTIC
jgi:hypothetical protein